MDLPWNPAVLEQRIARIHRMGQARPVRVINFVAKGTIEEGMLSVLAFKRSLSAGILDGGSGEISLGGSRLNRFMKDVENVTGHMGEGEAVTPAEEVRTIVTADDAGSGEDIADVNDGADAMAIVQADAAGAFPRDIGPDPWQALVQVGTQFIAALAAANNPSAPAHPWIERDPATGAQHQRAHHFPKDVRSIGNGAHTILPAAHIILPRRAHHFCQLRMPFCLEAHIILTRSPGHPAW